MTDRTGYALSEFQNLISVIDPGKSVALVFCVKKNKNTTKRQTNKAL